MTAPELRPLQPVKHRGGIPTPPKVGPRADFRWIPVDKLMIDDRYQRAIADSGKLNIMRILGAFDWRKFAPIVVCPIEGTEVFAIIDGQHRATSALMHPDIDEVPCMVIDVSPAEAAECFAAINGQVTSITRAQLHTARVAAGDPLANGVEEVAKIADVRILKYKNPNTPYAVGETLAIGTLENCLKFYGREVLITALQCITQTRDGNPGCVAAMLIKALCDVLAKNRDWLNAGGSLFEALDSFNFPLEIQRARTNARNSAFSSSKFLVRAIMDHLAAKLKVAEAAE